MYGLPLPWRPGWRNLVLGRAMGGNNFRGEFIKAFLAEDPTLEPLRALLRDPVFILCFVTGLLGVAFLLVVLAICWLISFPSHLTALAILYISVRILLQFVK